jgi:hypothetical protein
MSEQAGRLRSRQDASILAFVQHHRKSKKSKKIPKICGNLRHLRLKKVLNNQRKSA